MSKYICFRFDVDTHTCIREGMTNILSLFNAHDARCTFFVNMGSAFDRSLFLKEQFRKCFINTTPPIGIFSMFSKLGFRNSLEALLLNPKVGLRYPKILHRAVSEGHELGLHGGRNHAQWEANAKMWSRQKVTKEIEYGCACFKKLKLPVPVSFASPCWQSPDDLSEILSQSGFSVLADQHSGNVPEKDSFGLFQCPLNITGKQANVGFVENFKALGYSSQQILDAFEKQLDTEGNYKMVFDHPLYVGIHELEILSAMIVIAKQRGYKIESLRNICKHIG